MASFSFSNSTFIFKYLLPKTQSSLSSISITLTNLNNQTSFGNNLSTRALLLTQVPQLEGRVVVFEPKTAKVFTAFLSKTSLSRVDFLVDSAPVAATECTEVRSGGLRSGSEFRGQLNHIYNPDFAKLFEYSSRVITQSDSFAYLSQCLLTASTGISSRMTRRKTPGQLASRRLRFFRSRLCRTGRKAVFVEDLQFYA